MAQKYCTCCGNLLKGNERFCEECGMPTGKPKFPFENKKTAESPSVAENGATWGASVHLRTAMGKLAPSDDTLTMLAEYCTKTVATVGGDGYTEWVLNRRADGGLQLDYYRNYVGYENEIHTIAEAPGDTWERIVAIKDKYRLGEVPNERNVETCGGYTLVKIREGEKMIRIVNGLLNENERTAFIMIKDILTSIGR